MKKKTSDKLFKKDRSLPFGESLSRFSGIGGILIFCAILVSFTMVTVSCTAKNKQDSNNQNSKEMKVLISYFSATGTTKAVAEKLSKAMNADIYEIRPEVKYSSADLNWNNEQSRSSVEMRSPDFRPPIADKNAKIENYDVIFIGFPIWWYIAPTIINTFLESYDFSGKTVILFATSGGSGFGKAVESLKGSCSPTTVIKEGKVFRGRVSDSEINDWVKSLNY